MIKLENTEVLGWEAAIRGMRNPMNSWEKSDSKDELNFDTGNWETKVGPNDHKLMMNLAKAGSVDAKYRRMIVVTVDITAPLYWWNEFDTYKVGTVANSCSTMHKIHDKEFTLDDFSHEHLIKKEDISDSDGCISFTNLVCYDVGREDYGWTDDMYEDEDYNDPMITTWAEQLLKITIESLNFYREKFLETKDKCYWWQMIQLLPTSYNQRRTVMLNYEVLAGIYPKRKDHKLDCWHDFCDWIESLPYSELITLKE